VISRAWSGRIMAALAGFALLVLEMLLSQTYFRKIP
jgi:hypothetical protein